MNDIKHMKHMVFGLFLFSLGKLLLEFNFFLSIISGFCLCGIGSLLVLIGYYISCKEK